MKIPEPILSRLRVTNKTNRRGLHLVLLAFVIGVVTGLVGSLFRWALSWVEKSHEILISQFLSGSYWDLIIFATLSSLSIYIALYLVKHYAAETSGSGVQEIEGALDGLRSLRWQRVVPIKFIASLFSLGSGLLLGREGPTIQIGANLGRMVKDIFKQPKDKHNPLVSAGAAAGLATAFNAPFSGVIFVIEEMNEHFEFNFYSVISIMVGASTADILVRLLLGSNPAIEMKIYNFSDLRILILFLGLGLVLGIIGYFYNKILLIISGFMLKNSFKPILVAVSFGILLTLAGLFSTDMIGSGYQTIYKALNQTFSFPFLIVLFGIRFLLSILSYSSGVSGGIFAPLLTLGVIVGMITGLFFQHFFPKLVSDPGIFAVAGMAGIFAATVRAPLTGLVLAVEVTSNYQLILPLVLTTATAAVITTVLGNKPIYSSLLERLLEKNMRMK